MTKQRIDGGNFSDCTILPHWALQGGLSLLFFLPVNTTISGGFQPKLLVSHVVKLSS